MTTEQLLHIAAMYIDEIYAESYPLMKKNREFRVVKGGKSPNGRTPNSFDVA